MRRFNFINKIVNSVVVFLYFKLLQIQPLSTIWTILTNEVTKKTTKTVTMVFRKLARQSSHSLSDTQCQQLAVWSCCPRIIPRGWSWRDTKLQRSIAQTVMGCLTCNCDLSGNLSLRKSPYLVLTHAAHGNMPSCSRVLVLAKLRGIFLSIPIEKPLTGKPQLFHFN